MSPAGPPAVELLEVVSSLGRGRGEEGWLSLCTTSTTSVVSPMMPRRQRQRPSSFETPHVREREVGDAVFVGLEAECREEVAGAEVGAAELGLDNDVRVQEGRPFAEEVEEGSNSSRPRWS